MLKLLQWVWCIIAYRVWLWLPLPRTHQSPYGRFTLWLLGYAGAYAPQRELRGLSRPCGLQSRLRGENHDDLET